MSNPDVNKYPCLKDTDDPRSYLSIYQEEDETAPVKSVSPSKRILGHKRHETNGRYGIRAHDLNDSDLKNVKCTEKKTVLFCYLSG
jgi:hypothetical protein